MKYFFTWKNPSVEPTGFVLEMNALRIRLRRSMRKVQTRAIEDSMMTCAMTTVSMSMISGCSASVEPEIYALL